MKDKRKSPFFKWGATALLVIFISILLVVIFTNLPGFFSVVNGFFAILAPLLLGAVFAFLLNPIVRLVERLLKPLLLKKMKNSGKALKLSRGIGIVASLIFAALVLYAFFSILLPQLEQSISGIVDSMPTYYAGAEKWVTKLIDRNPEISVYVSKGVAKIENYFDNWTNTRMTSDLQTLFSKVTSSVISVVRTVINLLIGLCCSIYILASKDTFQAQSKKILVAVFKPGTADHLLYLGREINRIFNGFVIGKIIDSAIIGVLCYVGMLIFKMPYPALIATVVGVTNVIPFFGPFIGAVPSVLLILLVDPLQALYFTIFVVILQQIDGNIIGPKILGDTIGISGFWVLVSITVATGLFGFIGMLLGVPVFAVIYLIVTDAVNLALHRKGRTTETEKYQDIQTVSDLNTPEPEEEPAEQSQR